MNELPPSGGLRSILRNRQASWLVNLVVLALIVSALFLPPLSLGQRPTSGLPSTARSQVWSAADPDGTELTILTMGLAEGTGPALELTSVPRADLLAGTAGEAYEPIVQALPSHLSMKSPLYQILIEGVTPTAATLRIPIPNDAEPLRTLDVYGWVGNSWRRLDGRVREKKDDILVQLDSLPEAAAVMQTQEMDLVFSAPMPANRLFSQEQLSTLAEIHPEGGLVEVDGSIQTKSSFPLSATPGVRVIPSIRNWTDIDKVRRGWVDSIIHNKNLRQAHIKALNQFVAQGNYDGVDIDYRGLVPQSRVAFTQFITELAQELHPQGKLVSVRVSLPTAVTPDQWDTGPYDWPALSQVVDILRAPMPVDPRAYRPNGQAGEFLDWAVGEADRYKLQLVFMPLAVEQVDSTVTTLPYDTALALLTRLDTASVPGTVVLSDQISLEMPILHRSSGLLYDEPLHTWWFTYLDERRNQHAIWLNNAEGLVPRAALASSYHLRGISIEGLAEPGNDPNLWVAVRALRSAAEPPVAEKFTLQWQTTGPSEKLTAEMSLVAENAAYAWKAPSTEGAYQIAVVVAQDGQPVFTSDPLPVQVVSSIAMVTPTPTPLPTSTQPMPSPTPIPTSVPSTPTPTPTSMPPTPTPTPTSIPPTATPTRPPAPTATFTPAPTPTPSLLSPPELSEPESGASFPKEVRLKWLWSRRLEPYEKFAVRWQPVSGEDLGEWWVDEVGILGGGGAINPVDNGFLFEVSFGLGPYPAGEAYWSVAVFAEKSLEEKWQVSEWSERRQIFKGQPPR